MELSIKAISLYSAVILAGLSAGFFLAWQVSVIPGNKQIPDISYLQSMQSINRAILNPVFFVVFFGAMIALGMASYYELDNGKLLFRITLAAFIAYAIGTFGVTALGNVPLNNELDTLNIAELSAQKASTFRKQYESNWNKLHLIRTGFALVSFLLMTLVIFIESNK